MKKYNINDLVKLKLTKRGCDIIDTEYGYLKYNDDNEISMQLHEAFNIFGEYLYNGCEIPFETEITLLSKTE